MAAGVALYFLGMGRGHFTIRDFYQIRTPGWVGMAVVGIVSLWAALRAFGAMNRRRTAEKAANRAANAEAHRQAEGARQLEAQQREAQRRETRKLPPRLDPQGAELTDDQIALLRTLTEEPMLVDDLVEASGIPVRRVLSALTMLEIDGYVSQAPGKRYARTVTLSE